MDLTPEQEWKISMLDDAIDRAAAGDDAGFFAAVAAKDEYLESIGLLERDELW